MRITNYWLEAGIDIATMPTELWLRERALLKPNRTMAC